MPDEIGGATSTTFVSLINEIADTSLNFMVSVITDYWYWILGLVVLVALARRFKRLVGLAR